MHIHGYGYIRNCTFINTNINYTVKSAFLLKIRVKDQANQMISLYVSIRLLFI